MERLEGNVSDAILVRRSQTTAVFFPALESLAVNAALL